MASCNYGHVPGYVPDEVNTENNEQVFTNFNLVDILH